MSPAMMVLAGSRVVGPMLRANWSVPPRLGAPKARVKSAPARRVVAEALPATNGLSTMAADPVTPYFSRSRRLSREGVGICTLHVPFVVGVPTSEPVMWPGAGPSLRGHSPTGQLAGGSSCHTVAVEPIEALERGDLGEGAGAPIVQGGPGTVGAGVPPRRPPSQVQLERLQ